MCTRMWGKERRGYRGETLRSNTVGGQLLEGNTVVGVSLGQDLLQNG